MKTSDFDFNLPEHLIAQYPPEQRGQSRLMTLDRITGKRIHAMMTDLPEILCDDKFLSTCGKKPLLVFNDTKVRKVRLFGIAKETGAKAEFLLIEKIADNKWKTIASHAKRRKMGSTYLFFDKDDMQIASAKITEAIEKFRFLEFDCKIDDDWLFKYGHIPLPPYIKRNDTHLDEQRYQTIYAQKTGSAAAPTAGLHFTEEILERLTLNGIEKLFLTLHVGLGTFLPVRTQEIEDHKMHEEIFFIADDTAKKIETAKKEGRKIIAVGTTSLRALESAAFEDNALGETGIKRGTQSTSIFIYPGYKFKVVDALFTNFHTPLSSLLMLVSAFAGRKLILESYAEAVKKEYRFFSYGDAMLIY